jgi:hypothetical protein
MNPEFYLKLYLEVKDHFLDHKSLSKGKFHEYVRSCLSKIDFQILHDNRLVIIPIKDLEDLRIKK